MRIPRFGRLDRRSRLLSATAAAAAVATAAVVAVSTTGRVSADATPKADTALAGYSAFVAESQGASVEQINASTEKVTASALVGGGGADDNALSPDGTTLYSANAPDFYVQVYRFATKKVTKIVVGAYPQDVAVTPDGTAVLASVTGSESRPASSDELDVISTSTDTVTGSVRVGGSPRTIAISADGRTAYVATDNGVAVVNVGDITTPRLVRLVRTPRPVQDLALAPDGSRLYATSALGNELLTIALPSDRVVGHVAVPGAPRSVAVAPDGSTAYVTETNLGKAAAVDTRTGRITGTLPARDVAAGLAVTPDGTQLWITNAYSGLITVDDIASGTTVGTIAAGSWDAAPVQLFFAKPAA